MTLSTRTLTQTLAALAIAASIGSGVLCGATAAHAAHVDNGQALVHGHRTAAQTLRSHIRWQFPTHLWQVPAHLWQAPAHPPCILCAQPEPGGR
jgi:hypothetical protein